MIGEVPVLRIDKLYSPQMVVTTKYTMKKDITKKRKKEKTKQMACTCLNW